MANLYNNTTVQNIREFLETQITSNVYLHFKYAGEDKILYNVKPIWGGDTYYIAYSETDNGNPTKFLPINANNIQYFELV